jgi:hypothetical protein
MAKVDCKRASTHKISVAKTKCLLTVITPGLMERLTKMLTLSEGLNMGKGKEKEED